MLTGRELVDGHEVYIKDADDKPVYGIAEQVVRNGKALTRLVALRDIRLGVPKGSVGGLVQCPENVVCIMYPYPWVADEAVVMDQATINDQAIVCDEAVVMGNAQITSNSIVCDKAVVMDDASVYNDGVVCGNAVVGEDASIDNAVVCGNASVKGRSTVSKNTVVGGAAVVGENARVWSNCRVFGDTSITGKTRLAPYSQVYDEKMDRTDGNRRSKFWWSPELRKVQK